MTHIVNRHTNEAIKKECGYEDWNIREVFSTPYEVQITIVHPSEPTNVRTLKVPMETYIDTQKTAISNGQGDI